MKPTMRACLGGLQQQSRSTPFHRINAHDNRLVGLRHHSGKNKPQKDYRRKLEVPRPGSAGKHAGQQPDDRSREQRLADMERQLQGMK
jgi:hypothetical protein